MSDPADIPGWQRLTPRITTSGRLAESDPARLAGIGVRHVVNLALADSPGALAGEAELMAAAGLRYTHIPVPFDAPDDAHYRAFCAALDGEDAPVHVHCIMNYRVSAFFYRRHVEGGMDPAEARATMEQIWSPHSASDAQSAPWRAFVEAVTP